MLLYMMLNNLKLLFQEKHDTDERDSFLTIEANYMCEKYGVLLPSLSFWTQLFGMLIVQTVVCQITSIVVYKFIIQKRGSKVALLTGYGIIIPTVLVLPFQLIRFLDIRNMSLMMALAAIPIISIFRCLEAMYGFSPPAVEAKLENYLIYFSSVIDISFDPSTDLPVRVTKAEIVEKVLSFIKKFFALGALYSIVEHYSYAPFSAETLSKEVNFRIFHWFQIGHLANNFVNAYLTHLSLSLGTMGVGLAINLVFGMKTIDVANNPMFKSTSPSDFWGRRWNQLVHGVLKRGVFKPVRKYFPKVLAIAATFIASGILHEYVLKVMTIVHDDEKDENGLCDSCFTPSYGNHVAFFIWNGIVLILEHLFGGMQPFQWMKKELPKPVVSMLVIMTSLPVAHLFTDEYVKSGFFSDYKVAFPLITCLE